MRGEHHYPTALWPQECLVYLRANYKGCGPMRMASELNARFGTHYTTAQVRNRYNTEDLHSEATGIEETLERTQREAAPIGSESIDSKRGKVLIKVRSGAAGKNFVPKHLYVWEQAHGPVPNGYDIHFKDGNKQNCALENLELISHRANCLLSRQSGIENAMKETLPTRVLIARVDELAKKITYTPEQYQKKLERERDRKARIAAGLPVPAARRYPEEVKEFVREHCNDYRTTAQLREAIKDKFGFMISRDDSLNNFMARNGIVRAEKYPASVRDYIAAHYQGTGPTKLTAMLNAEFNAHYDVKQIRGYCKKHKYDSGLKAKNHPTALFPEVVLNYMQSNAKRVTASQLTRELNKMFGAAYTVGQVSQKCRLAGFK